MTRFLLSLLLLASGAMHILPAQNREVVTLTHDWLFAKGAQPDGASPGLSTRDWEEVSVPHDWAISGPFDPAGDASTAKLPWKEEGWYRRDINIPASWKGKAIYVVFDGVMAFPEVFVNGEKAGEWDYGYNSFYLNITGLVNPGEANLLAVHADTRQHDSRWYPGAGIYRKVQLLVVDPVHVGIWGTWLTTPIVKPHMATVRIATEVHNESNSAETALLKHQIIAPNGNVVAEKDTRGEVSPYGQNTLEANLVLPNPERWDIDHPALYTVKTRVYVGDELRDEVEQTFGVRTIRFDADHGFYLNDRRVQLKGVNLHHGHGPLGAAFYPRAMERQLEIMKSMGVNAIRNSHNTAAPELLELCDRMGLLVFDEIFDKYDGKADITRETDFEDFTQRNIHNFVVRDRNHPSIFLWSVGNEMGDVQVNSNRGHHRLHTMLNYVNKYDPYRPTTIANDIWTGASYRHFDYYDVHSWNYDRRYKLARQMEPNKAVIISESASTVSTRGFYEFPLPKIDTDFTRSLQVSSYDLNAPYWAEIADDDFMWQQEEPYIAGEFVWTGFDYLGEPTPYDAWYSSRQNWGLTPEEHSRSSYFGIVDLVGIPKDRFYLYKSYWKPEETTVHILPHWNWPDREGDTVPVFVYTNGDCAELFVNGESQGMQCKNPTANSSTERFRLMWKDVIYEPGEVSVVAYRAGEEIGTASVKTAGPAAQLRLSADRDHIQSGGLDLSYILVEAFDKDGNPAPLADNDLTISVKGAGELAGIGNGNPRGYHDFQGTVVPLFYGKAMVIVKSGLQAGEATVTVTGEGLGKESVRLVVE